MRATNAVASSKRKKRLFKQAKGYFGDRKNHLKQTRDAVMKAMSFQTKHRKQKKREIKSLWVIRINVAAKINGISYNKFINGLKKAGCTLNRKVLADIALNDPKAFGEIVKTAKEALVA